MSEEIIPKFFKRPADFRKWLSRNHQKQEALRVGFYKISTGKPSITWPESVDQALCFGWIDGIRKSLGDEAYMIRFTPRHANSTWSAVNLRKFAQLKEDGLIEPAGQAVFHARKDKHTNRYSFEQGTLKLAPHYEKKFKSNKKAWAFFNQLPPSVKKPSIWYVMSAKQEATQLRRLNTLIKCSEAGERIPQLRRPGKK